MVVLGWNLLILRQLMPGLGKETIRGRRQDAALHAL